MKPKDWLIPLGLILLTLVPLLAGTGRIMSLVQGGNTAPNEIDFMPARVSVIMHIVTSCLFGIIGALQFSAGWRKKHPQWHRVAGRGLVLLGLTSALTGLWLTQVHPQITIAGPTLYYVRLVVGTAMALSIGIAFFAALRRNFVSHSAWMMRGYALGMGAGTQLFTHLPWLILGAGIPTGLARDGAMAAGWLINLVVAEWIIRRR